MRIVEQYLLQLKKEKRRWRRAAAILTVLSLFVASGVAWNLRMTGITIANDACCGLEEHQHSEECGMELITICGYEETEPDADDFEELLKEPIEDEVFEEEIFEEEFFEEEIFQEDPIEDEPIEEDSAEDDPIMDDPIREEPVEEEPVEEEPVEEDFFEEEPFAEEVFEEIPVEEPVRIIEIFEEESGVPLTELPETYFEEPSPAEEIEEDLPAFTYEEEYQYKAFEEDEESFDAHVHSEECYEIIYLCEMEEHLHQLDCYSDLTADLEDWAIWEDSLPELTGQVAEDLVLIAQSQLGCSESEKNYELDDDGETRNGITRYGQWYGNPYGPWSNMFTSFCLHYAGFEEVSSSSSAPALLEDWEDAGLYRPAGGYEPLSGDVVFLDKNENGRPEATAIVVDFFNGVLTVIEGDVDNMVTVQEYDIEDPVITGYGITDPGSRLMMFAAMPSANVRPVAKQVAYNNNLLNGGTFLIYAGGTDGRYFALDGNGGTVEVWIDGDGNITSDIADQTLLYWEFTKDADWERTTTYVIRNVATGDYLHPNQDNSTRGPLHPDEWPTAIYTSGSSIKLRGVRQNAYVQLSNNQFTISSDQNSGTVLYFGRAPSQVTLWLDGTNGDIMSYRGSDNTKYTVYSDIGMQLPTTWKSPTKYSYELAGWVDIHTGDYYAPGEQIYVTKDTVLYADWVAATYDIGQYNSHVADTISTNDFITTHMFDYSSLINLLSAKVSGSVSSSGHSETWSHVSSGAVTYKGQETLDFSFNDHDSGGDITNLNNLNNPNKYTGGTAVYAGIYNDELGEVLFGTDNLFDPETGEGIIGKHYLGEGDHLFQINEDGYYYYDAKLNAASYNQSDERFYVYEYLARTSDSASNNDEGKYSDFLPLNSPYANTNGQTIKTYNYQGEEGEYSNVSHYEYDARYDSNNSKANQIKANLWFGMRVDVQFGLPDDPGTRINGEYGNQDIYGNDMVFKFTGDDDVWVLVDGEVILDLGGIHQASEGEVNFSTGKVTVEGKTSDLQGVSAGEHTLTILYLERGSSMSNCAIYFNLAPRFSLDMQKEDVLTQEVLTGAKFAFYYDEACTEECILYPSREAYLEDPAGNGTNVFTIGKDGKLHVWGLSPSHTYYIKEVSPPDPTDDDLPEDLHYALTNGLIRLTLDKNGLYSYSATILEEPGANPPISHGFTVHGFRIDEETQSAYINITNAQNWVSHNTSIYVEKKWNDGENHSGDAITAYLNVTDPDGTVRRLREVVLSEENDWKYTWTNMPMYVLGEDGVTESDELVKYSVSEAYVPGYAPTVEELKSGTYTETTWGEAQKLANGGKYLLRTSSGYLASVSESSNTLHFVDESKAKSSPLALWTATVSGSNIKLTNGAGQSINLYTSGNTRRFNTTTNSSTSQNLAQHTVTGGGIRLSGKSNNRTYYLAKLGTNGYAEAKTGSNDGLIFTPIQKSTTTTTVQISGLGFKITNTPLTSETSLRVTKRWDNPVGDSSSYEKAQITMRLLANGVDTGRTETISLKTNWMATFNGLPYMDEDGNPIHYTVVESWDNGDWIPVYDEVTSSGGDNPTYSTVVTNHYRWVGDYNLPATGGAGHLLHMLCGLPLVGAPLVYGLSLRRKHERRSRK